MNEFLNKLRPAYRDDVEYVLDYLDNPDDYKDWQPKTEVEEALYAMLVNVVNAIISLENPS